jgi:S1-C subfamily serine protease
MRDSSSRNYVLSGIAGGFVVLVLGGVLIATGVLDTGKTTQVVRETPVAVPSSNLDGESNSSQSSDRPTVEEIYKVDGPGVVFIQAKVGDQSNSPFGTGQTGTATGSGFVIDTKGNILTNAHVVEGARTASVRFEEGGDVVDSKVVGRDLSTDMAVLKVDPGDTKLRPLPLGNSTHVQVGDPAIAIGNPFGYDRTVTTGIISALQRQIRAPNGFTIGHVIQTDASINPGNSGGPLLNARGEVIGINSQIATGGSSGSVGIGFAVPINTAKGVIPQLERHGRILHAYLGVTTYPLNKDLAAAVNLKIDRGALVQDVSPGGPADQAGLRAGRVHTDEDVVLGGDVIVEVDGEKVTKPADVSAAIADNRPGQTVEIRFYRDNHLQSAHIKLATRPASLDPQTLP